MPDIIDEILTGPRKRLHPGGTKGKGTRGGKGRDFQVKCATTKEERAVFQKAIVAELGGDLPGPALRILLIRLAKKHDLLPAEYAED